MKANELMIGDWIKCGRRYMKVTQLTEDMDCDDIEPIPLTPEILEKNGFEKKTFYGIYDDYFDFSIREYSDGIYIVTYHSCEMNIPDETILVSWVHELQNFMKHCGIDKTIEL